MIAVGIMLVALVVAVLKMNDRRCFISSVSIILIDAVFICFGKDVRNHFLMYSSFLFAVLIVAIVNYKIYNLRKENEDE